MRNSVLRRAVLTIAALVFIVIAGESVVAPHRLLLGRHLDDTDAWSEFRAIYLGLWLATAALLLLAAARVENAILGDLGALLILGQVFGRLVSLAVDGVPTSRTWPIAVLELVGGVVLLALRPTARH